MALKKIVIIGAGGLARETKFLIDDINERQAKYEFLGYLVSDLNRLGDYDSKGEVLGDFGWFEGVMEPVCVAIGIGTPKHRLGVAAEIRSRKTHVEFPVLIHPNVVYDRKNCVFDEGVTICASNVLTVNIHVKKYAFLNLSCTVGHEAIIGAGCVINPTVNVSGGVVLGDGVLVGTGAKILQYLKVGNDAVIGAGACVIKDVAPGDTVVGIPAKPLNK